MSKRPGNRCLTRDELAAFARGQLTKKSDSRVLDHIDSCETCAELVQSLEENPDGVLRDLQACEEPDPYLDEPELQTALRQLRTPNVTGVPADPTARATSQNPAPESASRGRATGTSQSEPQPRSGNAPAAPKSRWIRNAAIGIAGIAVAAIGAMLSDFGAKDEIAPNQPEVVTDGGKTVDDPVDDPPPPAPSAVPAGFRRGSLAAEEPIRSLRVLMEIGPDASPLMEPVNLHLGLGFPLRLYPLGTSDREPSFAAFPNKSSVAPDANQLSPGESAWFEFDAQPAAAGLDEMGNTPALLSGLLIGDIGAVGFASRGETDWVLRGYEILINGELFVAHGEVNADPVAMGEKIRIQLEEQLPALQELENEVALLQTYVDSKLAGEKDVEELELKKAKLAELGDATQPLAGQLAGTHPWFVETAPELNLAASTADAVSEIVVRATAAGADEPGTGNHLFLQLAHRKYPITSAASPLKGTNEPQTFRIRPVQSPSSADFKALAVGMLGVDNPFHRTPDRAALQRLIVEGDGVKLYDSEESAVDRTGLPRFRLIPPAHRDDAGHVVQNDESDNEIYLWRPGTEVPPELAATPASVTQPADPESGGEAASTPVLTATGGLVPEPVEPQSENSLGSPEVQVGGLAELPSMGEVLGGTEGAKNSETGQKPAGIAASSGLTSRAGFSPAAAPGRGLAGAGVFNGNMTAGLPGLGSRRAAFPPQLSVGSPYSGPYFRRSSPVDQLLSAILQSILDRRKKSRAKLSRFNAPRVASTLPGITPPKIGQPINPSQPSTSLRPYTPAIYPIPTKNQPLISHVRIRAPRGMVVDGHPVAVDWQTSGDTSGISRYQVELNAIVPHDAQWFVPTPVAERTDVRTPGISLTPDLTAIQGAFADPSDLDLLYVQPKVTAVDARDQTIGMPEFGPLVPIAPQIAAAIPPTPMFLRRGFELNGDGFTGPWSLFADPLVNSGAANAWLIQRPENSHSGLLFDFYPDTLNSQNQLLHPLHNVAVRPAGSTEQLTIRFDATGVELQQDMRLIAHIGFLHGQRTDASTARVRSRVVVSDPWQPASSATATSNDGSLELLRIETPDPIVVSKRSPDGTTHLPMQVVEIPIRLHLPVSQYDALLSSTPHSVSDIADAAGLMPQTGLNVSVTFMVELENAALSGPFGGSTNTEAVGIFGVRLIPASMASHQQPPAIAATNPPVPVSPGPLKNVVLNNSQFPGQPAVSNSSNLSPEIQEFMQVHNDARSAVGVAPLQWSPDLSQHAQQWADELARRFAATSMRGGQKLDHRSFTLSTSPGPTESPYGENLAWAGDATIWSPADAARGWLAEKPFYENREPNKQVGHYTQMVWSDTTEVGYGIAGSGSQAWVVASYRVSGNVVSQFPYPGAPYPSPDIDPATGNAVW